MKKDFNSITNPAAAFLTASEPQQQQVAADIDKKPANTSKGVLIARKETKTKRVELLAKPSLIAELDKICRRERISRNELVSAAIERFIDDYKNN